MSSCALLACLCLGAATPVQKHTHHIVIEVNAPGKTAYATVLGNITNLRKALAPDPVEIEVVCEGKGIDMLLKSGPVATQIASSERNGVHFAACSNTMRFRKLDRKSLVSGVAVVDAGVAEVVRKQEAGWAYLKGAN